MNNVASITPTLEPAEADKVKAFVAFIGKDLAEFAERNGAPASVALVVMGDLTRTPLAYSVRSWTPGDEKPPKVVVQAMAAALLQSSIAAKMIDPSE